MKKLLLVAVACGAMATPALASTHVNVNVFVSNHSAVIQGGDGHGQANVALVAQGAIATVQAPELVPDRRHQHGRRARADRQHLLVELHDHDPALIAGGDLPRGWGCVSPTLWLLTDMPLRLGLKLWRGGD